MNVTLEISGDTYQRLNRKAKSKAKRNVEPLLDEISLENDVISDAELERRRVLGKEISEFRKRIFKKYGTMKDSSLLVREDRHR